MPAAACLDEAKVAAFVAGALAPDEREHVEGHVDDCDSCRQVLAALVRRSAQGTPPEHRLATAPGAEWASGMRVGRYMIRDRIGRGGMGSVWRAEDIELARPVALKRLHAGADGDDRARLVREARAAAQLQHPNVVAVYEVGEVAAGPGQLGEPFLAMELVDGETLAVWLKTPRDPREIVTVLAQAGRGLAAAHAAGLVHRDFKPDNVLIDRQGRARVVDFGLARRGGVVGVVATPGGSGLTRLTETGAISGTPAYLAPELVDGAPPDARSDQYAFAITAYEALHGHHPFSGATAEVLWTEMAAGRIRDGKGDIPARLDRHLRRGLAVDPAERWPSVAAMVDAIEHRPRRRWPWIAALGALVIANIAAVALVRQPTIDPCEQDTRLIDGVWNPAARAALATRFAAAAPGRQSEIATADQLADDWAGSWRLGHDSACHVDGAQRAARLSCLDRDLGELRAQLATWAAPDAALVDGAVRALAALPRPDDCAAHAPPAEQTAPAIEARIVSMRALQRAGRPHAVLPLVPSLVADAEAAGAPETLARALMIAGDLEEDSGDRELAREYSARAASAAARAGDDTVMFAAILKEAVTAIDQDRGQDALGLCDAAEAVAARAKLDRGADLALARGDALVALGRGPEAVASYKRAIALLEPRASRDRLARLRLGAAYGALGAALSTQLATKDALAALQHGLSIEEGEYGPDHPEIARTLHDIGNQEMQLGQADAAIVHYQRARTIFIAAYGPKAELVAESDLSLADADRATDRCDEANPLYERARAEAPDSSAVAIGAAAGLGQCALDHDDNRTAADQLARAVADCQRTGQTGLRLGDLETELGVALDGVGQTAEARVQAERALAEYDRANVADDARVNVWILLADLEHTAGRLAHALELDRKVIATLGNDPRAEYQDVKHQVEQQIAEWTKPSHR